MSDIESSASQAKMQSSSALAGSGGASRSDLSPWRRGVALVGIAALVVETVAALMQPPRVEPLRIAAPTTLEWWRHPIERNAIQRMPVSHGPLHAVHALPGTDEVWFAGAGGLIVHSTDGGRTWDSTNVRALPQRVPPVDVLPKAAPRAASMRGRARGRSAPRVALAAFDQERAPQYQNAPAQQSPAQQDPKQQSRQVVVPNVVGTRSGTAQKNIYGASLQPRLSYGDVTDRARDEQVLSQRPAAGTRVSEGTVVQLTVGRFVAPVAQSPYPADAPDTTTRVDSPSVTPPVTSQAPDTATTFYPRLNGICVTAAGTGWAVGERGAAFRTADRGDTWTQVPTSVEDDLTSLACNGTLGAIAGSAGGVVWLRTDAPGAGEARSRTGSVRHLALGPGDTVWMSGVGSPLRYSADTGRTWRVAPGARRAVAFVDATTHVAMDSTGRISLTTDAGRTWGVQGTCRPDTGAASLVALTIVPASPTTGLLIDDGGNVARTTDGWRTCTRVLVLDGDGGKQLAPVSGDVWYAVGDGAYRSVDGGRTWHALLQPSRFASLLFSDSTHGVAGLANGVVGTTSNGGRSWSFASLARQRTGAAVHFARRTDRDLFALDADERVFASASGGRSWSATSGADSVLPVVFTSERTGWGVGSDTTWTTDDGGRTWRVAAPTGPLGGLLRLDWFDSLDAGLRSLAFLRDANGSVSQIWSTTRTRQLLRYDGARWDTLATGILAASPVTRTLAYGLDSLGNLVRSNDGGRAWAAVPLAPPRKYPAPWYYALATFTVVGTLAAARARRPVEAEPEESIADILVSDRPLREGDRDVLDFGKIAAGLSRFIRNTRTEPPLTIAITGPWGTGKSSLMNLLRRDLERRDFRTIWFNAWHHQREESLLASLLEAIRLTATPPVWTRRGLRFRRRLLAKRFHRYQAALVLLPVFAFAVGYILKDPERRWNDLNSGVTAIVRVFTGPSTPAATSGGTARAAADTTAALARATPSGAPQKTVVALIISILGTILTYAKGLKAFGVKPGEVAKSVVSAGRVRTIEAQPAFRYRFAKDFGEVTDALKPERLVIFVDDLDRCKPEQVLEILEAINFLAESGDCVVVLGIDRERVTGCVAIGFKDVATVLAEARPKPASAVVPKPDIGAPIPPAKTNLDYQIEYARHYLEKLLNMEIPIPPATPEGLGDVMTSSAIPADETDEADAAAIEEAAEERRHRTRRQWYGRAYAGAVAAASVAFFLWGFGRAGTRAAPPTAPTEIAVTQAGGTVAPDTAVAPALPQQESPVIASTAGSLREPMLLDTGTSPTTAWWVHVPLALLALATLLWLLNPREDNRVEDSAAFTTALRAWAPVLFEEHPTPRSAKKFLNKMRFLSMAQRAPAPRRAPVDSMIARLRGLPIVGRVFDRVPSEEPEDTLLPDAIPEVTLVSLNVIRDRYPEWLRDPVFWSCDLHEYVRDRVDPVPADIGKALQGLGQIETRLNMARHREAWRRLELWVRDA